MKPGSSIVSSPGIMSSSISNIFHQLHLPPSTAAIQSSSSFTEARVTYNLPARPLALAGIPQPAPPWEALSARPTVCAQLCDPSPQLRGATSDGPTWAQGFGHPAPLHPVDVPSRIWSSVTLHDICSDSSPGSGSALKLACTSPTRFRSSRY